MYFSKKIKKFKKIKHCFFSKKGGFSNGLYKSLNCGEGSFDKKKNITPRILKILIIAIGLINFSIGGVDLVLEQNC